MTIPRKTLEGAAFWDQVVCLDCEALVAADEVAEGACPRCGSDAVYPAEFVLRCADVVGEEE